MRNCDQVISSAGEELDFMLFVCIKISFIVTCKNELLKLQKFNLIKENCRSIQDPVFDAHFQTRQGDHCDV